MSLWFAKGGPIMWPLLAISLFATTIIVERLIFWVREQRSAARDVLQAAIAAHPNSGGLREEVLEIAVSQSQRRLERGMVWLDTVVTAAPLLGILGTVLGIIESFELLSERSGADPLAVSGGVAEALITTATGLTIALVVIFPYNYFRSRVRHRVEALEEEANRLLAAEAKTVEAAHHVREFAHPDL